MDGPRSATEPAGGSVLDAIRTYREILNQSESDGTAGTGGSPPPRPSAEDAAGLRVVEGGRSEERPALDRRHLSRASRDRLDVETELAHVGDELQSEREAAGWERQRTGAREDAEISLAQQLVLGDRERAQAHQYAMEQQAQQNQFQMAQNLFQQGLQMAMGSIQSAQQMAQGQMESLRRMASPQPLSPQDAYYMVRGTQPPALQA
jgi:hypothetical protein